MTTSRRSGQSRPTSRAQATPSRYPLEPLADALGVTLGVPGRPATFDGSNGLVALAEYLEMSRGQVYTRLKRGGLDVWEADRAACKLGKHASEIWPEWGDELLDDLDEDEFVRGWSA